MEEFFNAQTLPIIFMGLMGLAFFIYAILDGYDLGVGILIGLANDSEKKIMLASIGPFWDANETWLVLGVGLLLVAFPMAHGVILTALYLPTALMLIGLILRGVSFDFRSKAKHQGLWDKLFIIGSLLTAISQGYMLGSYILGFGENALYFGLFTGLFVATIYSFIGAGWLMIKTTAALQRKAIRWAQVTLWMVFAFTVASLFSEKIKLLPGFLSPLLIIFLVFGMQWVLKTLPRPNDHYAWVPFSGGIGICFLGFQGLACHFYPYIIPEKVTIWQAASAPESLLLILIGALIVLPFILFYTAFAYKVFWGKSD